MEVVKRRAQLLWEEGENPASPLLKPGAPNHGVALTPAYKPVLPGHFFPVRALVALQVTPNCYTAILSE
jgi:hypothetical protein